MDFYELKRVFKEFDPRGNEEIDESILEYVMGELETPQGLMYLTERANSLLKDYLGYNEEKRVMSIDEIGNKNKATNMSVYENVKKSITLACFKIHCAMILSKDDPSVDVIDYYKAMEVLSTKTMNCLFRYFVFNLANFMSLDDAEMKKIRMLGNTGADEVKDAQNIIARAPRKEIVIDKTLDDDVKIYVPKNEDDSTKVYPDLKNISYERRQLLMNKLLILLNEKQQLNYESSKVDYEIKKLLGSIDEELGHGIK